jgi:UDP-2,3-diacylglucosamine hydrolase
VRHRDEIRRVVEGGDDNLLRGVVRFLEANGFPVRGVGEVAPNLMAPRGALTARSMSAATRRDMEHGFEVIRSLGPLDVGQAAVVAQGRVLAIEAAEGTDAMLRRVKALRRPGLLGRVVRHGRPAIAERCGGVLVKAPKPGQDFRVDLPVVGAGTVTLAAAAGLDGIAVQAGGVLVVERALAVSHAESLGLFLEGAGP